jgi:hypothetical protein
LGFSEKPLLGYLVLLQIIRQKFECDFAFQAGIFSKVDLTHTPFTQLLCDLVVGYGLADHLILL